MLSVSEPAQWAPVPSDAQDVFRLLLQMSEIRQGR
jgi:hypothetical protein